MEGAKPEPGPVGLEFCLAQEGHFEEVMSISRDVYGGIDYLPVRYRTWLQEPARRVMLAKRNGRVIALVSVNVVDDGRTAVVEGLRVAPRERGKGIAGLIQEHCLDFIRAQFPEVEVRRYTRSGRLGPEVLAKFQLICKQEILSLYFKVEALRPKLGAAIVQLKASGTEWQEPIVLQAADVKRVFLNPTVIDTVLPGKTIVHDWAPFKASGSNLETLLKQDIVWMADSKEEPSVLSLCTAPYAIPMGANHHRLNIDIFGKHFPGARSQFLAHLQEVIGSLQGPLYCILYMDPSLWQEMHSFCLESFGLQSDRDFGGQSVLEAGI
ncbi:histidine N-acetyltransferase-like [Heptranchias perlo]|uniref:histidine N-acetyltransferase-like n=1 Tax=Heptranchias perlo TaxID=212740 RepID=UPI00355A6E32